MNKEFRTYLHRNEGIVIRRRGLSDFVVRKLSCNDNLYGYNLIKLVKHPCVVSSKRTGVLFKIGVPSVDSIVSSTPVNYVTRLTMDYDNESGDRKLIDKFHDKFKKYSFILYTSWNNSVVKPRFRVIIKIKNPINRLYLKNPKYREYLSDVFSLGKEKPDTSCFYDYQCQLLPIVSDKNKPLYKYIINKGKKLELKEYENVIGHNENVPGFDVSCSIDDIVKANMYNNITWLSSKSIKDENKKFYKHLNIIKSNNFNKTKEYKNAKALLKEKNKPKKEVFDNKNEFLKKNLPKFVAKKNLEGFYKKWIEYYNLDIRSNEKWFKKFKEFLPKVAKYCNVVLEDLK